MRGVGTAAALLLAAALPAAAAAANAIVVSPDIGVPGDTFTVGISGTFDDACGDSWLTWDGVEIPGQHWPSSPPKSTQVQVPAGAAAGPHAVALQTCGGSGKLGPRTYHVVDLAVAPSSVQAGATVTFTGHGYAAASCGTRWALVWSTTGAVVKEEANSTATTRTAGFAVPAGTPLGQHRAVASCGSRDLVSTVVTVVAPPTPTPTAAPSATTGPTPGPTPVPSSPPPSRSPSPSPSASAAPTPSVTATADAPDVVGPGTRVPVTGAGCLPGAPVTVTVSGETYEGTAGADGSFTVDAAAPSAPGRHAVTTSCGAAVPALVEVAVTTGSGGSGALVVLLLLFLLTAGLLSRRSSA